VFNLQGSELLIILLLALVVLGPEKLPEAMRKLGEFVAQMKKMSAGFQQEFKNAVDDPMREVRDTASLLRDSVDFRKFQDGDRGEKPKSAEMADATTVATPIATPVGPDLTTPVDPPLEAPVDMSIDPPPETPLETPTETPSDAASFESAPVESAPVVSVSLESGVFEPRFDAPVDALDGVPEPTAAPTVSAEEPPA